MNISPYILVYRLWIFSIGIFCCGIPAASQVSRHAIPLSATANLPPVQNFIALPPIDSSLCATRPEQFACPIYMDINPQHAGQWVETPDGKIWRIGISSRNAHSLYLNTHYSLLPGVRMFVYGSGYQDVKGPYTSDHNNTAKVVSIPPVRGDKLIVELNLPASHDSFGEMRIMKVYHDFINIFNEPAAHGRKSLSGCEEDINCANGIYWQTEKRSVCKIISSGGMGVGTLTGNASGDDTPYVLSAHHLISTAEDAAEAVFLFNHETPGCGKELATTYESLSGAELMATTDHKLDFTLMKLNKKPPRSYQPYYAGWDARNIIPGAGVCIHHPFGGPKQIAIEYHPLEIEDIGEGFDANSTWKVAHWEVGTTEVGSSGSPLFNEKHRIVGTLTGGRSTCSYPRDDYFTKLSMAWNAYSDPSNQLQYWLDPGQTGKLVIDGYDPYGFNSAYCDTAWNYSDHDLPELSQGNMSWGWISGHNSEGYTQFAERFESPGILQINGAYLHVAKAHSSGPLANIELKVWEGTNYPEDERWSTLLFIKNLQPDKINYIAFDTALTMSGPFFIGYKVNYSAPQDTFALFHAADRGHAQPSSTYVYRDGWHRSADVFGVATSLGVGISECYGKVRNPAAGKLRVYPNPSSISVTLDVPGREAIREVVCFDSSGRFMPVSLRQSEVENRLYFDLENGIYYLKVTTKDRSFVERIIVLKQ